MEKRKIILFASIIGYLFIFLTYMFVISNPELFLTDKIHDSEEFTPPENLNVNLDPTHQYLVEITISYGSSSYDIEFELKLDNLVLEVQKFSGNRDSGRSGSSWSQIIIPIDEESIGEFEIIVKNQNNVNSVEYKIFRDPSSAYLFFSKKFVYLIPIGFIVMMAVVLASAVHNRKNR